MFENMWSEAKEKEKERNLGQCDFLYFVFVRTFFYFFAFDICFFSYGQLEAYYVMEISIRTSFSNCVKRQTFGYEHVIWFVKSLWLECSFYAILDHTQKAFNK
jgi:hypothetical protein